MRIRSSSAYDLSEAEFIALVTLADKIVDRFVARVAHNLSEPDPASLPSALRVPAPSSSVPSSSVPTDADTQGVDADAELEARLAEGMRAWTPVVRTWASNFEVEDAPQPDRPAALMAVFSFHSRSVMAYLRERGGLAGACIDTLARENIVAPEDAAPVGRRMALNMVQVGTAIGLPIDHLIERSLLQRDAPETLPLTGGLLGDVVDMTRPEYDHK